MERYSNCIKTSLQCCHGSSIKMLIISQIFSLDNFLSEILQQCVIANDYPYTAGVIFSFLGLIQQVGVHFQSSSIFKEFLLDNESSITDLQYSFLFNDTAVLYFLCEFLKYTLQTYFREVYKIYSSYCFVILRNSKFYFTLI